MQEELHIHVFVNSDGDIQQIGSFESVQDGLAISDASKSARSGSDGINFTYKSNSSTIFF